MSPGAGMCYTVSYSIFGKAGEICLSFPREETVFMKFIPLCSGSSGNSVYIEAGDQRILVDAGVSCRRLCGLLTEAGGDPGQLTAILITHEHTDHIKGLAVLSKKYGIPVYANADTWGALWRLCPGLPPQNACVFESDEDFYLGKVCIHPFTTPHDAVHSVGYTLVHEGKKCAVCTDIGHVDKRMLHLLGGSDILLLEANHDVDMLMAGPYPYALKQRILSGRGHLCNEDCGMALAQLRATGVKNAVLGHLSKENNFPPLAVATVQGVLEEAGITDVSLALARRDEPTGVFEV